LNNKKIDKLLIVVMDNRIHYGEMGFNKSCYLKSQTKAFFKNLKFVLKNIVKLKHTLLPKQRWCTVSIVSCFQAAISREAGSCFQMY
jgi:hypothetical protein